MTAHVEAVHSHDHAGESHEAHSSLDGLKFEKSELKEFVESDREAGVAIGQLLAVVFCVSLFLFVGVSSWMMYNESQGHDPHFIPGAEEAHH